MRRPISAIIVLSLAAFLSSCAYQRVAYKSGFDFTKIRTVRVGSFSSATSFSNSGSVVANEFIRQLLASGYSVTTSDTEPADAVIMGNVSEYQPNRRLLITERRNSATADPTRPLVVVEEPIELSGTQTYNLGTAFGLGDDARVIVSNATVGVAAYLKDISTGEIIWSNTYTYEGLDLSTAMEGAVRYLLHSLPSSKQ